MRYLIFFWHWFSYLADQFEEAAQKVSTEAQARRVLNDVHERLHGSSISTATVRNYGLQWVSRKKGEVAPQTHASYEQATNHFIKFLGDHADDDMEFIAPHTIARWRDENAAKASATTANNKLKILRVFFTSAWRDDVISGNPAAKVSVLKTPGSIRRPFTASELTSLLRKAEGEWLGMILFRIYAGQRLKDIANLTWANVDVERAEIKFTTSKTRRHQVIPLHAAVLRYLKQNDGRGEFAAPLSV